MWDQQTQTLTRSYREGKGPTGQTDDYAFLIQGLLEMYEASGDDEALSWAVRLQERQGELFWDEDGGGWFASGVDEHVLVRLKDSQVGFNVFPGLFLLLRPDSLLGRFGALPSLHLPGGPIHYPAPDR